MQSLIWSPAALDDLVRLRQFIALKNPEAAGRVAETLKKAVTRLLKYLGLGKRLEGRQDRELFVPFGKRGYLLRYRLDAETIVILRVWHTLEDRTPEGFL